ncbi:TetR/AcrR family transcriptional regulator [Isachenkonia alkalipeptolytica]|uniref:TetR/AcrR family transcriptional regulator n=1 Tax=Isachenkonia alkalipeptolytica TaxID=2565777 RepID=A0AA43XHU8_9CLOT|nr:TetR/AcrR family transcriptional regulator [Isachenkonia alkalipeptolytica]NBG87130.1 TetR/AcrR family transcriptional regulator [Isachenkonia alkalipeptolytica]
MENNQSPVEIRERLLHTALLAFNEKGAKFTLEDISRTLNISKKTIYTVFSGKKELIEEMIDEGFREVKEEESYIVADTRLNTLEKIRKMVIVIPERYQAMDFRKFATLKESYPELYQRIEEQIEREWDLTIELLEKGMEEGVLRRFSIPVFKIMIEATMERLLERDEREGFEYMEALEEMMDIVIKGIETKGGEKEGKD